MEFTQDKIDLIERIIKNDRKFVNNEDLYDDFFNETCKRSLNIVKVISSEATLEAYLKKIATTSILNVLKDSGRLRRTKDGFTPVKEVSISESPVNDYANTTIIYEPADIKDSPEDVMLKKDLLQFFVRSLAKIDSEEPEKNYLQIYKLRYDNGMTQKEIAEVMGLSQSEISKRLFKLMEKIKQAFN
ncbi:sigma-70 family RNA polymerase sigma factor [bacterium]|nr:sigma-70 family RNA polymerase sigma factor [bacterium]